MWRGATGESAHLLTGRGERRPECVAVVRSGTYRGPRPVAVAGGGHHFGRAKFRQTGQPSPDLLDRPVEWEMLTPLASGKESTGTGLPGKDC